MESRSSALRVIATDGGVGFMLGWAARMIWDAYRRSRHDCGESGCDFRGGGRRTVLPAPLHE